MNGDSKGAQVLSLGKRVDARTDAAPITSTETLAALAGEIARFEDAAQSGTQDPGLVQARVAGLKTMGAKKSALSFKRDDPANEAAHAADATAPIPMVRRVKPEPE